MEIQGRVALVTGAGTGIGRASALLLAERGASVVVVDLDGPAAERTAAEIRAAGGAATAVTADVSAPAGIEAMFSAATDAYGGVDIVHNNAGLIGGEPLWPDSPLEKIARVIAVNLGGVAMGTEAAIRALRARGGGAIVNTASTAALRAMPTDPVYSATKVGVVRITESCSDFAASDNIRVNCVLPGPVATDMTLKHTGDGTRPARWLEPVLATRTLLTPAQIAEAVVALVEDDTKAGEQVVVDLPG